jgi:flagellar biosynthesis protein FlhF
VQVHTFISESANDAVEQIRSQLGPAAVVLSVRKLPASGLSRLWSSGQIEVLASVPDESPAQAEILADPLSQLRDEIRELKQHVAQRETDGDSSPEFPVADRSVESGGAEERNGWRVNRFLVQTGVVPLYAEQISDRLASMHGAAPINFARQIELAQHALRSYWQPPRPVTSNTHIFVGPAGVGKSTVLCKWLAQTVLASGQPAKVCQLDTHAANASSLPALYSEILGAAFSRSVPEDFNPAIDTLFIDLPGISIQSVRALTETRKVLAQFPDAEIHLVLNAAYESSLLLEQARFFSPLSLSDIILTHLDEETRWGKIWNVVCGTNFNLRFFSAGQNIPGEFIPATPDRLFARQFRGK